MGLTVAGPTQPLQVRILGPLEVALGGEQVPVGASKQGAVLAVLATRSPGVVSTDALVEALWPERAPATATTTVQVYISRLRKVLGKGAIVSESGGYRLFVDELDATRLHEAMRHAADMRRAGRLDEASVALVAAVSLFRGAPLANFAYESWAQPEINRLEEERLTCLEERFELDLERGLGAGLVAELESLVAAQPLRERLRRHLMLALYRSGRQADALAAFHEGRTLLVEQLGVEPGPDLHELHRLILNHDPRLSPPRGDSRPRLKLPSALSSFVGRERELTEVISLLTQAGSRLLTLTGPGGVGKTRLAVRAASSVAGSFPDGVLWVPLAGLRDPALVSESIAAELELKEEPAVAIADRKMLILLDNFEQVAEAAPQLATLLSACANLTVLVTSRELLRVSGEVEYSVPPLETSEAITLFCDRARLAPSDDVAELCDGLDNLPLALELAAARAKVLAPAQIQARLAERLDLFRGPRDAEPRQRTLRAAIEWSYELLSEDERRLFRALSVFDGGCTLLAAIEVCAADLDGLQSLAEKSLVRFGDERYWMLETIREFAAERLAESTEGPNLRGRFVEFFRTFAGDALAGISEATEIWGSRLEAERANLRIAMSWARAALPEFTLTIAVAYGLLCSLRGPFGEGRTWLEAALSEAPAASTELHLRALRVASNLAERQGDLDAARRYATEGLELARVNHDLAGEANALAALGIIASDAGDAELSESLLLEALQLFERSGNDRDVRFTLGMLGFLYLARRDYAQAEVACGRALALSLAAGDARGTLVAKANLGHVRVRQRNDVEAFALLRDAVVLAEELHEVQGLCETVLDVSALAVEHCAYEAAATLLGAITSIAATTEFELVPVEVEWFEELRDHVYAHLDTEVFDRAWEKGRSLSSHDLAMHALGFLNAGAGEIFESEAISHKS